MASDRTTGDTQIEDVRDHYGNDRLSRMHHLARNKKTGIALACVVATALAVPAAVALTIKTDPTLNETVKPAVNTVKNSTGVLPSPPTDPKQAQQSVTSQMSVSASVPPQGSPRVNITVDGESIPVPENGSVYHTTNNGQTSVDISVQNSNSVSSSASGGNFTSFNVYSNSNSSTYQQERSSSTSP